MKETENDLKELIKLKKEVEAHEKEQKKLIEKEKKQT